NTYLSDVVQHAVVSHELVGPFELDQRQREIFVIVELYSAIEPSSRLVNHVGFRVHLDTREGGLISLSRRACSSRSACRWHGGRLCTFGLTRGCPQAKRERYDERGRS